MIRSVTLFSSYIVALLLMAAAYSFVPPPQQEAANQPSVWVATAR